MRRMVKAAERAKTGRGIVYNWRWLPLPFWHKVRLASVTLNCEIKPIIGYAVTQVVRRALHGSPEEIAALRKEIEEFDLEKVKL